MALWASLLLPSLLVWLGMWPLADVRAAFLLYVFGGCMLGPLLFLGARPLRTGDGMPLWSEAPRGWLVFALQFLLLGPAFYLAYQLLLPWVGDPARAHDVLLQLGWNDAHEQIYAGVFLALVPLAEEWWWRGRAQPLCERRWGVNRGRWISATLFALYHGFVLSRMYPPLGVALRMPLIVCGGRVWAALAGRFGWGMSYAGHFVADATIVIVYLQRLN
jgi:membrane protease YdiL (CAAX protease family)